MIPYSPTSTVTYAQQCSPTSSKKTVIPWSRNVLSGHAILADPRYNKELAFTAEERCILRLGGLLPPRVETQDDQVLRAKQWLDNARSDLDRYSYLATMQRRNERLFFRVLHDFLPQLMPIVYTPTVGLACQRFGHEFRHSQGMYISYNMKGGLVHILQNWPETDVRGIVFSDGERILGLGDLGCYGMGIPIGKLALYTACAGIPPDMLLPVILDVGTDNEALLKDPVYTGLKMKRIRGQLYDEFIDEFISAVRTVFGRSTLLQFEDFANANAYRLLQKYRKRCCTFNDDIQGTAAVVVSGILTANKVIGSKMKDHKVLMFGSGAAGIGIAELIVSFIQKETGKDVDEARKHIILVDSRGLVTKDRPSGGITAQKAPYAVDLNGEHISKEDGLEEIVRRLKPTAIIGVAAQPNTFTQKVCELMCENAERPIIFPLSNPTSKAECTAKDAYTWTKGRCIFASGSPFEPVTVEGKKYIPGQGNNSYIFPGLSLGVIATRSYQVTDDMLCVAAIALANCVDDDMIEKGLIYPPLSNIREVSVEIAKAVAEWSYDNHFARRTPRPDDLDKYIRERQYELPYPSYAFQLNF